MRNGMAKVLEYKRWHDNLLSKIELVLIPNHCRTRKKWSWERKEEEKKLWLRIEELGN